MPDYQFDSDEEQQFLRRYGQRGAIESDKRFPRVISELISRLYEVSDEELIPIIANLDNQNSIDDFSEDINQFEVKPERRDETEMKNDFLKSLVEKIEKCFVIIRDRGIDLNNPEENKFRTAIKLLFTDFDEMKVTKSLFKAITDIILETTNFSILIEYLNVLYHFYSSQVQGRKQKKPRAEFQENRKVVIDEFNKILNWKEGNPEQTKPKMELFQNQVILKEEEGLILRIQCVRHLEELREQINPEELQNLENKTFAIMKKGSCQTLLQYLGKCYENFNFVSKVFMEFLECKMDLEKKVYISQNQKIHKNMLSLENVLFCVKHKKKHSIQHLRVDSVKTIEDKIYCKFNIGMLETIEKQVIAKKSIASGQSLFDLHSLIAILIENQEKSLVFIEKYSSRKVSNVEYICKLFQIMTKYLFIFFGGDVKGDIQICYEEQFITRLLENFRTWTMDAKFMNQKYMADALGDLYSFSAYYLTYFEKDLDSSFNLKKKLVEGCIEFILQVKSIPQQWRYIKHIRLIMEKWAVSNEVKEQDIQVVIEIFWNAFLSHKFKFTRDSYLLFIRQNEKPNQKYQEYFSKFLLSKVQEFSKKIVLDHDLDTNEQKRLQKNIFIFKIHLTILGNFKLVTAAQIAKILHQIYSKYSTFLPAIYYLRTWINYHYKPTQCDEICERTKNVASSLKKLTFFLDKKLSAKQCLEMELPASIQNQVQTEVQFRNFIEEAQRLINLLQLKNESQNLPDQCYGILIQQIINPLSDNLGTLYHRIISGIVSECQLEESQKHYEKVLVRNFFSAKKSIYRTIHEILFSLRNIIRLYLCNITLLINFDETRALSLEIGKLFENLSSFELKEQKNRIQLMNELLANYVFKKKSHLVIKQTLNSSIAYKDQIKMKDSLRMTRNDHQSLNVIIPIYSLLKGKFSSLIKLLTSYGREEFEGRFRFNHQIAFEHQLRKLLPSAEILQIVVKNTLISHAMLLLNSFFLPNINNINEALEQNGLYIYLQQFKQIFESEQCSDYIQDHITTFINIYKFKNRSQSKISDLQRKNRIKGDEPTDFTKYEVEPLKYEDFKLKAKEIIKKFLDKLPQKILNMQDTAFKLKTVLNFIKELSAAKESEKKQEKDEIYSTDTFMKILVEKCSDIIDETITKKIAQKQNNNSEEKKTIQNEEQKKKQKSPLKKKLKKKKGVMKSPLKMVFKILAHINKDHTDIVKYTFEKQIHKKLLDFIKISTSSFEINEIYSFVIETIPHVNQAMNEEEIEEIAKYYEQLVNTFENFTKKIKSSRIFTTVLKLSKKFEIVNKPEYYEYFIRKIMKFFDKNISGEDILSSSDIKNVMNFLFKTDQKSDEKFFEFEIKTYLRYAYMKKIKEIKNIQSSTNLQEPNKIQIEVKKYLNEMKSFSQRNQTKFNEITRRIFEGWTQNGHKLVYSGDLGQLTTFDKDEKFYNFQVPQIYDKICSILIEKLIEAQQMYEKEMKDQNQEQKQDKKSKKKMKQRIKNMMKSKRRDTIISCISSVISKKSLCIPYLIRKKIDSTGEKDFLQWLIETTVSSLQNQYLDILTSLLCENGIIIDHENHTNFGDYVCSRIITYCLEKIKKSQKNSQEQPWKTVYLFLVCLTNQNFNRLSKLPVSDEDYQNSLVNYIQKKFQKQSKNFLEQTKQNASEYSKPPSNILLEQCLYLAYRFSHLEKIKKKNGVYESTAVDCEQNFINPSLYLTNGDHSGMTITMRSLERRRRSRGTDSNTPFKKLNNPQDYSLIEKINKWETLEEFIEGIEKLLGSQKICSQQKKCLKQLNCEEISYKIISSVYKYFKNSDDEKQKDQPFFIRRLDGNYTVVKKDSVTDQTETWEYLKSMRQIACPDKKKEKQERHEFFSSRNFDSDDSSSDQEESEGDYIVRPIRQILQEEEHMERRRQNPQFGRRFRRVSQSTVNPADFIQNLSQISPNSERLSNGVNVSSERKKSGIKEEKEQQKCEQKMLTEEQELLEIQILPIQMPRTKSKKESLHEEIQIKRQEYKKNSMQKSQETRMQEEEQSARSRTTRILSEMNLPEAFIEQHNMDRSFIEKMSEQQQINVLLGLKSEQEQKESSQSTSKQEQKSTEEEQKNDPQLLGNENYQRLQKMSNYYERCNFLIDAPESFFSALPPKVMYQIIRERDVLLRENDRSSHYKLWQNRRNQEDFDNHIISMPRSNNRMHRFKKRKSQKRITYSNVSVQQQQKISDVLAVAIIKTMFIKIQNAQNNSNGINLLLEISKDNVKYRTLTTLLYIFKNFDNLKILYCKQDEKTFKWVYKNRKSNKTISQQQVEFKINILKLIETSIERCLFGNEDLITKRIKTREYYPEVFDGMVKIDEDETFKKQLGRDEDSYMPLYELFDIALDNYPKLATIILTKTKSLPEILIKKMFNAMCEDKLPKEFYEQLKEFSQNQLLIKLFREKYTLEDPPTYQLLGRIMKYKFGYFDFVKKIHEKALKYYMPAYNEFLREIFRFYTIEQIESKKEDLLKYRQIHYKLIEELFSELGSKFQDNPIKKLVEVPDLLEYKTKQMIFRSHPSFEIDIPNDGSYESYGSSIYTIHINNNNVLGSSYNQIMSLTPKQFRKRISVQYIGQDAYGSGMFRVWLELLAKQLFNPSYLLFVPLSLSDMYQPNPYSYENPEHLNYFKFMGRLLGVAILQEEVFPGFFTQIFYKMLLNKKPRWEDLREVNPELFEQIRMMINSVNDKESETKLQEIGYTFVYKGKDIQGEMVEKQLIEGGRNIIVTDKNLDKFIEVATKEVLTDFCSLQYQQIKEGFNEIIPEDSLDIFSVRDIELLISGVPDIDIAQFKKYTTYQGFSQNDPIIKWFWQLVNEASKQDLVNLLQFITGSSKLTEGGFENKQNRISISNAHSTNSLPRSQTCFKRLYLPEYESKEKLKDSLLKAFVLSGDGEGLTE